MSRLLAVRGLPSYYLAATAARVGDEMVGIAVVLLVLQRTGSPQLAGAVVAAYLLPTVLSGPVLGAWLDRTRHRRAALAANQILLGLVMLGLLGSIGAAPAWVAVGLASLVGLTVPMTSGGFTSLLPRLVPGDLLPRAHAFEGIGFNASAILGPATAATMAAAASPAAAVLAIVGFAVLSLLALTGLPGPVLRTPPQAARPAQPLPAAPVAYRTGLATAVRDGLAHLLRTRPLRSVTVATSVAFLGVGMLTVAVPLQAERLAGDAALGGFVWTAVEVGAVATALAWGRWHARWRPERVVLASLAGSGLVLLGWPFAGSLAVLLGLAVAAGLAQGGGMPALFTTRQRYTPARWYAQISTTGASLKLGAMAAGAALAGHLTQLLGPPAVLGLVAASQLVAAAIGASLLRARSAGRAVAGSGQPA
ncbi:MAG: MFS transporter [Micromonosporaceae bacterium]|nr:MFS transporter [Micromonosporaceae bacterium]